MEILTTETFKTKIYNFDANAEWKFEGDLPTIIDFYADWCGPCKKLSPILEEISKEYEGKLRVFKVDTEATPELAALFGVRGIPSLLYIPQGEKPQMNSGFLPKDALKQTISKILKVE